MGATVSRQRSIVGSVLVSCGGRLVLVDLDKHDMLRIGAISQYVEPQHAWFVATCDGVLVSRGQESLELFGYHRDVDMDHKQGVRHEPTLFGGILHYAPRTRTAHPY